MEVVGVALGSATSAMNIPQSTIFKGFVMISSLPRILLITLFEWGVHHEKLASDAYHHMTGHVVKPTRNWMFNNNIIYASPD